jgi:hypothetical protein
MSLDVKKLADLDPEELQALLRKRRALREELRLEMDAIEEVLAPKLNRAAALEKLQRAGLSAGELAALQPEARP